MPSKEYRESQSFPSTIRAVTSVASGVVITFLLAVAFGALGDVSSGESVAVAAIAAVVALITLGLWRLKAVIQVDSSGLVMRLSWLWRRRVNFSDISSADIGRQSAVTAGGVGLRFLGNHRVALLMEGGDVVQVHLRNSPRTYLLGATQPRKLTDALASHGVEIG